MSETDSASLFGAGEPAVANIPEFSVSEIAGALKRTVEGAFPYVRIRGEISGFRGPHSSGHAYFALKDEGAKIDAVCFRGVFSKVRAKVQEGLEVIATGRVTTYPGKSSYQIIVESIEPAGAGALLALLEERRKKLAAEGLFDDERKKPLPYLPAVIGVVTSPTGAVIRDILHRLRDRFPRTVLVWPVSVQGEKAAGEVAAAIEGFNALKPGGKVPRPDILIVARGGGSIEDLWAFNEEIVVRAVFASTIPIISAVGHETDTTLIDYVSDRRAPTPTAAAEMAVPVRADLLREILNHGQRLETGRMRVFTQARQRLTDIARALPRRDQLLEGPRQRFDHASGKLANALNVLVHKQRARLETAAAGLTPGRLQQSTRHHRESIRNLTHRMQLAARRRVSDLAQRLTTHAKLLETLSHRATLERGFAMVTKPGKGLARHAKDIKTGDKLELTFADGTVGAVATDAAVATGTSSPSRGKTKPSGQPDLF